VFIDKYWDRLWILLVSHGFLAFVGLSRSDLHSPSYTPTLPLFLFHLHLGQLCWCEGGIILGIYGITYLWGKGKEVFDVGALRHFGVMPRSA